MEKVLFLSDLCRYITKYLSNKDILAFSQTNKCIRNITHPLLPKDFGKLYHLEKLSRKYSYFFLQECVQTKLQAKLLYKVMQKTSNNSFRYLSHFDNKLIRGAHLKNKINNWKKRKISSPLLNILNKKVRLQLVL